MIDGGYAFATVGRWHAVGWRENRGFVGEGMAGSEMGMRCRRLRIVGREMGREDLRCGACMIVLRGLSISLVSRLSDAYPIAPKQATKLRKIVVRSYACTGQTRWALSLYVHGRRPNGHGHTDGFNLGVSVRRWRLPRRQRAGSDTTGTTATRSPQHLHPTVSTFNSTQAASPVPTPHSHNKHKHKHKHAHAHGPTDPQKAPDSSPPQT